MMKKDRAGCGGFSLVEVIAAIAVLGIVTASLGGCLVMAHRINGRSEQVMQARLAVSNAVETLMAEGFVETPNYYAGRFDGITVDVASPSPDTVAPCYKVTVEHTATGIKVTTTIHPAATVPTVSPSPEPTGANISGGGGS